MRYCILFCLVLYSSMVISKTPDSFEGKKILCSVCFLIATAYGSGSNCSNLQAHNST